MLESRGEQQPFDVFALTDAVPRRCAARFKILRRSRRGRGARADQWALREVLLLARLERAVRHGDNIDAALEHQRLAPAAALVKQAIQVASRTARAARPRRPGAR